MTWRIYLSPIHRMSCNLPRFRLAAIQIGQSMGQSGSRGAVMENPTGKSADGVLRLDFDRNLVVLGDGSQRTVNY